MPRMTTTRPAETGAASRSATRTLRRRWNMVLRAYVCPGQPPGLEGKMSVQESTASRSLAIPMPPTPLMTKAEETDYRETSRHADVMRFVAGLQARADKRLHVTQFGKSPEGRELP